MSDFNQLILSINSRIGHEKDFAFTKNNGDIANRIRDKFSLADMEVLVWDISLDEEGDIAVGTAAGSWYVTGDTIFLAGLVTTLGGLTDGTCFEQVVRMFDILSEERQPFRPTSYQVGVLFTARFLSPGPIALRSQFAATLSDSILGMRIPGEVGTFKVSSVSSQPPFSDSLELEASKKDVQLRYGRQAPAAAFKSYRDFLNSTEIGPVIAGFQHFIEPLVTENAKLLRGRIFKLP